ncbi:hypothetical protein F4780DRAFT_662277 [Xylariomycetidae sp. FL0641]|nr:hypothetical protein F4780DRAFT_662277 [Xylariomycetidae sp. FL0641]
MHKGPPWSAKGRVCARYRQSVFPDASMAANPWFVPRSRYAPNPELGSAADEVTGACSQSLADKAYGLMRVGLVTEPIQHRPTHDKSLEIKAAWPRFRAMHLRHERDARDEVPDARKRFGCVTPGLARWCKQCGRVSRLPSSLLLSSSSHHQRSLTSRWPDLARRPDRTPPPDLSRFSCQWPEKQGIKGVRRSRPGCRCDRQDASDAGLGT